MHHDAVVAGPSQNICLSQHAYCIRQAVSVHQADSPSQL